MSRERPSGARMLVTVAVVVVVVALVLLAVWAVLGWLAPRPRGVSWSQQGQVRLASSR